MATQSFWPEAIFRLQPYAARCKRYLCSATIFFTSALKIEDGFPEKIYSCCSSSPRTLAERRDAALQGQGGNLTLGLVFLNICCPKLKSLPRLFLRNFPSNEGSGGSSCTLRIHVSKRLHVLVRSLMHYGSQICVPLVTEVTPDSFFIIY